MVSHTHRQQRANQAKDLEQFLPQEALQVPGNGFLHSCRIEISQFLSQTMLKRGEKGEGNTQHTNGCPACISPGRLSAEWGQEKGKKCVIEKLEEEEQPKNKNKWLHSSAMAL